MWLGSKSPSGKHYRCWLLKFIIGGNTHQPKNREAKPRRRRDAINRVPRGGEPRCPTTPPVGRDKSGPYALLAALVTCRLMPIGPIMRFNKIIGIGVGGPINRDLKST